MTGTHIANRRSLSADLMLAGLLTLIAVTLAASIPTVAQAMPRDDAGRPRMRQLGIGLPNKSDNNGAYSISRHSLDVATGGGLRIAV